MELQAATVNARLAGTQSQADQDALLQRLAQERTRNLSRIATLLNRSGGQITGDLNSLAACELNNGVLEDNGDNAGNGGGGAPAPSATPAPADTATPAPTGTATPAGTQAPDGNGSGGNGSGGNDGAAGSGGNGGTGDGSGDAGSGGDVWFEDSGTGY